MNLTSFIKHKYTVRLAGLFAANAFLFGTTNAATAPPLVIMVGFLLLVVTIFAVVYVAVGAARWYGISISLRSRRRFAVSITGVTGLLVALQSIGGISGRDILVLMPLAALGYMYSVYTKTNRRNLQA